MSIYNTVITSNYLGHFPVALSFVWALRDGKRSGRVKIAALRLDKARRSYRSSVASSEVFSLKMRKLFFALGRHGGK